MKTATIPPTQSNRRKTYFAMIKVMAAFISAIALSASFAGAAQAPKPVPSGAAVTEPQSEMASSKVETARMQSVADQAQTKIQRNKAELEALVGAVRSNNTAQVKEILSRNGFNAKDLENAKIALKDKTGGKSGSARFKITYRCCPPEIIISF